MPVVKVSMRDGTAEEFPEAHLSSYKVRVRHEPGWVIIQDAWGETHHFPADLVAKVTEGPDRGR